MSSQARPRSRHARRKQQSGMVMLIVMVVLLMATMLAGAAVQTVSWEARSAGYYRQQAQTHYVADAAMNGLLAAHPSNYANELREEANNIFKLAEVPDITDSELITNYGEPNPGFITGIPNTSLPVHRMPKYMLDAMLTGEPGGGPPVMDGNASIGMSTFVPWYVIDFTDFTVENVAVAGQDASGNASAVYITATVTVRGRMWAADAGGAPLPAGMRGSSTTVVGNTFEEFSDSAYDTRAIIRFGPVPQGGG